METAEKKELNKLLPQLMEARGVNPEKLAALTGIPKRFLTALIEGSFEKLPARPYVRAYLLKVASALEVNPEVLLQSYKEAGKIPSSGEGDMLPKNRFAFKPFTWRNVFILIFTVGVLGYFAFRINHILGVPTLTLISPDSQLVQTKTVKIQGFVTPGDSLTLNNEVVYTGDEGKFETEISLDPGLNTLEFTVRRFLGRDSKVVRQIFYQPSE